MSGVNEKQSEFSNTVSRQMLKKPVKFVYSNGLVQQVFAEADDPTWSVNMKKGIINMLQVDVLGEDRETGLKDFFTKEEVGYSRQGQSLTRFIRGILRTDSYERARLA